MYFRFRSIFSPASCITTSENIQYLLEFYRQTFANTIPFHLKYTESSYFGISSETIRKRLVIFMTYCFKIRKEIFQILIVCTVIFRMFS